MGAEKMSKSLGNTVTIRDLVQRHDPEAIRLYLIGTHYRAPVEWTESAVADSARALERLRDLVHGEQEIEGEPPTDAGALPEQVVRLRRALSRAPWTTTSTPRRPWRRSSTWPARSTHTAIRCSRGSDVRAAVLARASRP